MSDLPPSPEHRPVSLLPAALVSSAVRSRPRSKAFGRRSPLFTLGRQILVDAGVYGGNNYTPCCCIAFAALYLESTPVLRPVESFLSRALGCVKTAISERVGADSIGGKRTALPRSTFITSHSTPEGVSRVSDRLEQHSLDTYEPTFARTLYHLRSSNSLQLLPTPCVMSAHDSRPLPPGWIEQYDQS